MLIRIGLRANIERGNQIAPAEQLSPQRATGLDLDREVHKAKDALVAEVQAAPVFRPQEPRGPVHLVADHQDLLVEGEGRPPFRGERSVLGHSSGFPRPTRAKVISRTRSRIDSSGTSLSSA